MSIAGVDAERQPKLGRVRGVEVFQVGLRKGKRFTESDLDDAVANFQKFSSGAPEEKLIDPSVALGHDEQEVKNDGLPRYGTLEKLWKEKGPCNHCGGSRSHRGMPCGFCDNPDGFPTGTRTVLKSDFSDVPQEVGQWIDQKAYNRGSIEFFPEKHPAISGIPTKGIAVRRFVLLGAALPAVKSLAPLQSASWEFTDWPTPMRFADVQERDGMILCFSEVDVDEKRQTLQSLGLTADTIAKMSDSEVDALIARTKPDPKVHVFTDMCMADAYRHCSNMGMMVEPSQIHPKGKVHPKETLKAFMPMSDIHRTLAKNGYEHHGMGKFVHKSSGHEMHVDHDGENPHIVKYSETPEDDMNAKEVADLVLASLKPQVESQVKEVIDGALKKFSEQFEPIQKDVRDFKHSTHRDAIQKFCEDQLAEGRIFAYEMDGSSGLPTIVDRLSKLDTAPVHKFSDGGKESTISDLDVAKLDILKRPTRFSEKSKQGKDGRGTSDESGTMAELERFAEEHADLIQDFGMSSKQELIDTYKNATEKDRKEFLALMKQGLAA